ncbi:MAG: hypothetical protein WCT18_00875 [Patescibacteria group bacterium]
MPNQTKVFETKDVNENKIFAVIAYLGFLCFVPLLMKKDSPFAQAHARMGFVLFVGEVILSFINIIPILGQMIWFFGIIGFFVICFKAMTRAWRGEYWAIPYFEDYAKKIKI